jgi:NitT/TauT family transport system substrate-binding protein
LTPLRVVGSPDEDIIGALWGAQSGIFRKYGLDVSVQKLNSGAAVSAGVIGGSIDIGKSNGFGLVLAHAKGIPFLLQAPASNYSTEFPSGELVVAKDSPIRSARDLNGKTLAVPAIGDLFSIVDSGWIDQNGGDSRTVKFLELPIPAAVEAVAAGRVDAATIVTPLLTDAVKAGRVRVLGKSFDSLAKHFTVTYYFTSADFASKNADVLARFRKGLAESVAYVLAHQVETAPVSAKFTGGDLQTVETMHPVLGTSLQVSMIQPIIDAAVKYKAIPAAFSARDMIDPAILRA